MQRHMALAALAAVGLVSGACGTETAGTPTGSQESGGPGGEPSPRQGLGAVATWSLSEASLLDPTTSFLPLEVTRLGCSGGVTGSVLDPVVEYKPDRVVVRTDVELLGPGGYDCQGNDAVPVEVVLDEPLGVRELVDGACMQGKAVDTAACPDAVRWAPPAGLQRHGDVPIWQSPSAYSFTVQSSCGEQSFIGEYAVTVGEDDVVAVEALRQGWGEMRLESVPSISDMLDLAREAEQQGEVDVWVDPGGTPRWLDLDPILNAVDDENCFLITEYIDN